MNTNVTDIPDDLFEQAIMLQDMLIAVAQNGFLDQKTYLQLRANFTSGENRAILPSFVLECRNQGQLWAYFKGVAHGSGSWAEREKHIYGAFQPLLDRLEVHKHKTPVDLMISQVLANFDPDNVQRIWEKALARKQEDPEGAIDAARTLLETVCKHILGELDEAYGDDDLPKLYKKVAKVLTLSPSQHTETAFREILGGCHTIVKNLGTLRNRIGDAHGKGRNPVRPAPRHAALAVNLAGSMATFLVETLNNQKTR